MQNLFSMNKKNPLLSISLLTANRPDTIIKCLDSLTSLRQNVPSELIIVDTGCDQDMLEIIKQYTDIIISFKWNQDFAAARNAQLSACKGQWFLFLDDDEWFENTDEIEAFFLSEKYKKYDFCNYIQRNYHDNSGLRYSNDYVTRMARISPILHFESCIHEYMVSDSIRTYSLSSYVHHYGYVYDTDAKKYDHYQRNITLLQKMLKKEPDNIRWYIHAVQEYWAVQQYSYVTSFSTAALSNFKDSSDPGIFSNLGTLYMAVIEANFNTYNYDGAIAAGNEALKDHRLLPLPVASINEAITRSYAMKSEYTALTPYALRYFKLFEKYHEDISVLSTQSGFLLDETFTRQYYEEVCWIMVQKALSENDLAMLKEYFDKIDFSSDILFTFNPDTVEDIVHFMAKNDHDPWYITVAEKLISRADHTGKIEALIKEYESSTDTTSEFRNLVRIFSQIQFIDSYIAYLKILSYDRNRFWTDDDVLSTEEKRPAQMASLQDLLNFICYYSDEYLLYSKDFWEILLDNKVDISASFGNTSFTDWKNAVEKFCSK